MSDEKLEVTLEEVQGADETEKKRRNKILLLALLLLLFLCVLSLFLRYLIAPEPLPEMILPDDGAVDYPPHYLFSIYDVERPFGIALSPDEERIYVTQSGGERIGFIFDRDGDQIGEFVPPNTSLSERSMVYLTTDLSGNLYVVGRLDKSIFVFDEDGNYLDTILDPTLSLSEYISKHIGGFEGEMEFSYTFGQSSVLYSGENQPLQSLPSPGRPSWEPLGVAYSAETDQLLVTSVNEQDHYVLLIDVPGNWEPGSGMDFELTVAEKLGAHGEGNAEFLFPNKVVIDSQARIYVTDGNNGRVSVWTSEGEFLYNFGRGTGEGSISLPRGMAIDDRDRLFVVDAVGQNIKVYDVSGEEPLFLYAFGELGYDDGMFNFPNDIVIDSTGRVYIIDRENNRIQIWSY